MPKFSLVFVLISWVFAGCLPEAKERAEGRRDFAEIRLDEGEEVVFGNGITKMVQPVTGYPLTVTVGKPDVFLLGSREVPLKARVKVAALDLSKLQRHARGSRGGMSTDRLRPAPDIRSAGLPERRAARELDNREGSSGKFSFLNSRHGLPTSVIRSLLVDTSHCLWISTTGGVSRFDGKHFSTYGTAQGMLSNDITAMLQDRNGDIWFGAYGGSLTRFDGSVFYQYRGKNNIIYSLAEDAEGHIWGGTKEGGTFSFHAGEFTYFGKAQGWPDMVNEILIDREGHKWLATNSGLYMDDGEYLYAIGIHGGCSAITMDHNRQIWFAIGGQLYSSDGKNVYAYQRDDGNRHAQIQDLVFDEDGNLWMGTSGEGVWVFDGTSFTHYGESDGLPELDVNSLVQDRDGGVWVGCKENVARYNGLGFSDLSTGEGLPFAQVSTLFMDSRERLWMSSVTDHGLACLDERMIRWYTARQGFPSGSFMAIAEDSRGTLWLALWGIGLCSFDGKSVTTYTSSNGLFTEKLFSLAVDGSGHIWCSSDSVLIKFEPEHARFVNYFLDGGFCSRAVIAGHHRDVWVGSCDGLLLFDSARDSSAVLFRHVGRSLEAIRVDREGHVWTAPYEDGLYHFDGRKSVHFSGEGLNVSNTLGAMAEDQEGNLWLGTFASGLVKLDIGKFNAWYAGMDAIPVDTGFPAPVQYEEMTTHFGFEDGFLPQTVHQRAGVSGGNGEVWFGTSDGVTRVDPQGVELGTAPPLVQLSAFRLFNQDVDWTDPGVNGPMLAAQGTAVDKIRFDSITPFTALPVQPSLPYTANNITFQFGGIYLRNPEKLRYQFKLQGMDRSWSAPALTSEVNYGNLAPGRYTFLVRGKNTEGEWGNVTSFPFVIRPPWWGTWWARLLYVCLAGGIVYMARRVELNRQRLKFNLSLEKVEAERLKELDVAKSRLYTNITHEFRTPLTVILGMADQLERRPQDQRKGYIGLIRRNGRQLLSLINQMLDLAKLESHQLSVQLIQGDMAGYLGYAAESFRSLADQKDIRLEVIRPEGGILMDFDEGKIMQVISNLLSNAIKFTPPGGEIVVKIWSQQEHVWIEVKDTGEGISPEQLPHIFTRFYQADNSHTRKGEGTGIGLTLTKELVRLMDGEIGVESERGRGSVFTVRLPIRHDAPIQEGPWAAVQENLLNTAGEDVIPSDAPILPLGLTGERPLVLIIEDNPDVMTYLVSCVGEEYQVERAMNGIQGIERALEIVPDLVITDVMMPGKDGFEVCDTLKKDMRTSHVPVIILTAKATVEDRIAGLARGADAYLAKPFHPDELMVHLGNLIALRKRLQDRYSRLDMSLPAPTTADEQVEDAFLLQLRSLIETNLDNAELSIEDVCKHLAMSRMQLHRKIKALTDRSTSLYIRGIRLQHGRRLLEAGQLNVSQTAYAVGFEDPNYFSRVFQEEFGILPSDVRAGQA